MVFWKRSKNPKGLRVIETARSMYSINRAVKKGLNPLIKKVEPSNELRRKYSVGKNKKTGKIEIISDYRMGFDLDNNEEFETVIDWTYYYPYSFNSPFAAYLIPNDIAVGERVFIKDLIEDVVGTRWNQGDNYRLEGCEAIWNGKDFELQYNPRKEIIG